MIRWHGGLSDLDDAIANFYIVQFVVFEFFRYRLSHVLEEAETIRKTGKARLRGKRQTVSRESGNRSRLQTERDFVRTVILPVDAEGSIHVDV